MSYKENYQLYNYSNTSKCQSNISEYNYSNDESNDYKE